MSPKTRRRFELVPEALVALLFFAAASPSRGQAKAGPDPPLWRLTPFGGSSFETNPYTLEGAKPTDVRLRETGTYGLRFGREISSKVSIEIAWSHAEPILSTSSAPGSTVRRRLNDVELGVNRYLPLGPVRGLLELGIGARGSRSALGGANLTADLGAGFEVPVIRPVFLRIDERFRETYGNLGPGDRFAYCDRTGCFAYRHRWFANWETLGGVTYSF